MISIQQPKVNISDVVLKVSTIRTWHWKR